MKNTFEGADASRLHGSRPVAVVSPLCRSSNSASVGASSGDTVGPGTVPSSAVLSKESEIPLCLRAPSSITSPPTAPPEEVPFIRINYVDRRRSDDASTKTTSTVSPRCSGRNAEKYGTSDLSSLVPLSSSQSSSATRDFECVVNYCNFYYRNLTNVEAKHYLHRTQVGTFLLRDSSDHRFRYSLSVKTSRGTTSIRISVTSSGRFRLDSDPERKSHMPSFGSVLELIEHYYLSASTKTPGDGKRRSQCVLLESSGRSDTPMILKKPLELSAAPLAHLCRRCINNIVTCEEKRTELIDRMTALDKNTKLELQRYLFEYPFRV